MIFDKFLIATMAGSFATMIAATLFGAIADIADVLGISGFYLLIVAGIFACVDILPPLWCLAPCILPLEACILLVLTAYFMVNSWFWPLFGTPFFIILGTSAGAMGGFLASIITFLLPHRTVLTAWIPVVLTSLGTGIAGSLIGAFIGVSTGILNFIWAPVLGWPLLSFIVDFPMGILFGFPTGAACGFASSIAFLMSGSSLV